MKSMSGRFAGLAGVVVFLIAGLAGAATPLLVPLPAAKADAKSTDRPVRFNAEALEPLAPGAEVELTLPNGSRHDYIFESSVSHGGGFRTWIARSPLSGDNERAVITYGPHGAWGWMKTTYGDYRIYPSGLGYDLIAKREPTSYAPKFTGGDAIEVGPDDPRIAPLTGVPTILEALPGASVLAKGLKATPSPVAQSDIMFLYTKDLAQKVGVGLLPMIYNVVASLNLAYSDSEVAIILRLVNATMIDYANGDSPSANGSPETLDAMAGSGANAAFFEALTWGAGSLRDTVGADFVALLRDGPSDTGGIATLPRNPVIHPDSTVTSSTAYSVNNGCARGCEGLVAHEVGHNMGNHHDPATIAADGGTGAVSSTGVFSYSYGYYSCANGLTCNPFIAGGCPLRNAGQLPMDYATCAGPANANDFGTIMSYFGPKPMKFSNPLLNNCVPPGGNAGAPRICGGSLPTPAPPTTSNNALSMNNVRGALSAYRNQTIANLPGSLQFTNTAYTGAEGATLTFTVSRASGSSGAVSVNYAVTPGSATSGTDYTAASGTLTWIDGDSASKTFNVTLAADALVEGVETLTATLSNASGALGAYLGYPTTATGLIVEPWPLGSLGGLPTDPAGWSTPPSPTVSSVAWSIVNDSAPVGDPGALSLKSGAINFAGVKNCTSGSVSIPCPSAVELTRTFSAGTIAYAYRVSAFPGNGFLELLVDNVVVHSATGVSTNTAADTGWQFFSTTLTAGTHTLRWQYRPVFSFACQFAGDGVTAFYPGCLDRAWIDQLALPANTAPGGSFDLTVTRAGTGTGTVTSSPAGISCGSTCAASFASGSAVTLTAAAASGSTFTGWSGGACSGTGGCTVTVSAATTVTATFTAKVVSTTSLTSSLNPSLAGQSVTFTAAVSGSSGTATGTVTFKSGTTTVCATVALASGQAPCVTAGLAAATHSMTAEYSGDATYLASTSSALSQVVNPSSFTLTVSKTGTGTGTVTSSAAGISCGSTCAASFASGTSVTLSAVASSGSTFAGWSGGGCSGTGGCTVTMNAATTVTATFTAKVASTTTLASSLNPSTAGQSVTFTASVGGSGPAATGTVAFKDGSTTICANVAVAAGGAQCATGGLSVGTHSMTAEYSGDATYLASTSTAVSQVVNPSSFTLTVSKTGTGTGTVTSSPAGVTCGSTCAASFASGASVTLSASPAVGTTFSGWSGGGCSGTAQCTVTLNAATTVTATFENPPRLANIATRMQVLTGDNVLIGGFIIGGSAAKTVVVRARGPSLIPLGVPNALANPTLSLYSGQTVTASNDNFGTAANLAALNASGFAPSNALESAILTTLNPGAYTAIVSGVGGTTGVGIVEVFEVDAITSPLINIATRGQVLTGGDVMIGGFIIQGNGPQTVVVRARGPSLTALGVPGALANPVLNLYSGQTVIASNDDWQTATNAATLLSSGFAPANARESAILITLNPGAYTAIVSGAGGTTGVGIVEVFTVP